MKTEQVLGAYEEVNFPEYGLAGIVAKVDTGADTGALHCTNIKEEEIKGGKRLHFAPFDHPELIKTADTFLIKYVKSSNGQRQRRYFIETTIEIADQEYPITLSLADRSEMKIPLLIGRGFLEKNRLLVDVRKNNH